MALSNDNHDFDEEVIDTDNSGGDSSGGNNQAANTAKNQATKLGKKGGGKLTKKLLRKVVQIAVQILAKLMALLGPYGLLALAILILVLTIFYISFDVGYESRGKEKEYQMESVSEDNDKKQNEEGDYEAVNMSSGNKVVKSYYAYYTQQSFYKVLDGKMHKADDNKVKDVKDKYNREKEFMLSPDFLWALDEYLNNDNHRFPEQFIQPVYHDAKTFELEDLTDKRDELVAKSQKYDKKTHKAIKGEKIPGVWDYGFAPILQYKQFQEERESRGNVTEKQVWNKDKQKFENTKIDNGKAMTEGVSGYPQTVYMIEKVTTSIGTIENKITHEWQNTGETWTKDFTENVTVDVRYTVKETRQKRNKAGLKLYYVTTLTGEKTKETTILPTLYPVLYTVDVEKWKKETRKASRKAEGFVWSKEPMYEGEPDTSKIKGSKYMEDYMYHYIAYLPKNVMGKFDLENRTGKDIKELDAILKETEEDLGAVSEYDNTQPGTSNTAIDKALGVAGGSDKFKKAMQYATYFQKYGDMYGIDPLLLAAKAAQERGGVHSTVKDPGGALGVMQIQVNSHVNTNKSAFNYKTGQKDTVYATMAKIQNLETNIQLGAIIMQNSISEQKYNPLLGLQAYNYGTGGMNKVVKAYASAKGITADEVRKNSKDTGWMPYREKVHGKGYGDVQYIEHVLSHYPGGAGQKPYVFDKEGNKVFVDGDIQMGAGIPSASSGDGFSFWDIMDALKENWGKLFPDAPQELSKERFKYDNRQIGDSPIDILNMSFSMTEGKYFSEYEYITPEMWKEKYRMLFSNPPSPSGGVSDATSDQLNKYFPNGFGAVVAKAEKIAVPYNGSNISIQAPAGSKVLAITDGVVKEVGRGFVTVDHGTGAVSRYSTLQSVSVKEGDKVKQGATLGISNTNVVFEVLFDGSPTDPSWAVNGGSLTGVFVRPLVGGRLTSSMAPRVSPTGGGAIEYHTGADIAAPTGTSVKASAGGVVLKAGVMGNYGNMIHIKHMVNGKPMSTVYAHLSSINVKIGDTVAQGQIIGGVGSTGRSTGPHLHFEIQNGVGVYKDSPLDPTKFVKL